MKISLPHLPDDVVQTAREWRANMALIASIVGAAALTIYAVGITMILWKGGWTLASETIRIKILGDTLLLVQSGSLVVLVTLGFAINRRSVRIGPGGIETTGGGDDDSDNAQVTTVTATATIQNPPVAPTPAPAPVVPVPDPDPVPPPAQ